MREIDSNIITNQIETICMNANYYLNSDIEEKIKSSITKEVSNVGINILQQLLENAEISKKEKIAICQDTGMLVAFVKIGNEVIIKGDTIEEAINEGVRRGYKNGFLRKSVVKDPLKRENTKDNTPAIIHYEFIKGDKIIIDIAPKGFGSENMSRIKMLKPSDGIDGVEEFIIETVELAGPNPCPPMIIGVGIGGTFEKCAILSKKALIRPINIRNSDKDIESLELRLLDKINKLGIGPAGLGGKTTALGVNIETYATHIAGLPVAVNISCHATRHQSVEI